jgi:hypothetical protein
VRRRWWILPLIAAVLMIAPVVIQSWKTDQQVLKVIEAFCTALRTGNSDAAVELLVPEQAEAAHRSTSAKEAVWRSSPFLKYQVQRLKVRGDEAVADLWMFDGPLKIRPSLKLRRSGTGTWRIAKIDGLPKPTPEEERETALKREREERSERLVMELEQAIGALPGNLVERPQPAADSSR